MRRRGEPGAADSDRRDPFDPSGDDEPPTRRLIDWEAVSHAFVPMAIRDRAIAVRIETGTRTYDLGEPVDLTITFRNRLPIPIRLRTDSPRRWTWAVDGCIEASRYQPPLPDRPATVVFARNERKRFRRRWSQRIRLTETEWEPVEPGNYTLTVQLSVPNAEHRGLVDTTDIEIRR